MQKGTPVVLVQISTESAPGGWPVPILNRMCHTAPATGCEWSRDPRGPALLGGIGFLALPK